jgi:hypothetical protein
MIELIKNIEDFSIEDEQKKLKENKTEIYCTLDLALIEEMEKKLELNISGSSI